MFFRLCNSPVTFQMMMNDILQDFIHNGEAICYMDDILIYSHTLSNHRQIIRQVLTTLRKQRLFLKPEKCKFEQKEVEYLGLVILKDHVAMDLMKVCRVMEWPTPTKVKEAQSFLGFMNFYWKFIHDFSDIACPLYALTCKTQQWVWGSPEQEVFDALKKAVTSTPILTFPSQSGHFHLECNTSNFATGATQGVQLMNTHETYTSHQYKDESHKDSVPFMMHHLQHSTDVSASSSTSSTQGHFLACSAASLHSFLATALTLTASAS